MDLKVVRIELLFNMRHEKKECKFILAQRKDWL